MSRSAEEQATIRSRGRPEGLSKRWSAQRKASDTAPSSMAEITEAREGLADGWRRLLRVRRPPALEGCAETLRSAARAGNAATRASPVDGDEKGLRDEPSELPNPISSPLQRFGQLKLALFRFPRRQRV